MSLEIIPISARTEQKKPAQQATQQVETKKKALTTSQRRSRSRKYWKDNMSFHFEDRVDVNLKSIQRAVDSTSFDQRENVPNLFSLSATLSLYPDLLDAFDPDWEIVDDHQAVFEKLPNYSTIVYELATGKSDPTLIEYTP